MSRQRDSKILISGKRSQLSGLWHQRHESGQPFRKTVVRIPGPSWMEKRWMSKQTPVGADEAATASHFGVSA